MDSLLKYEVDQLIENSVNEDLLLGDATTDALFKDEIVGKASILAKSNGILCGSYVASKVFKRIDPVLEIEWFLREGDSFVGKDESSVAEISGSISSILKAERTAINFLQHLSGIATMTKGYVDAIAPYKTQILDTRKTIPGLRHLQKYAVTVGGGKNHRKNLGDGILIKDNHIKFNEINGLSISDVVKKSRDNSEASADIEVEVDNLDQFRTVLVQEPDIILLDNMDIETMKMAVKINNNKALLEASGGVTLSTVKAIAETGVDLISVGALTHSSSALDMSLNIL